jgi:hypothetical protein
MGDGIMYKKSPEEQELDKKLAELATLEATLAERELILATLQAKLNIFEREYLQVIGIRYAKLDELEAEIAKYLAFQNPQDSTARKYAQVAWTKAQNSKRAIRETAINSQSTGNFQPLGSLKKLYREVAKRIHPDLATDEVDRLRRQKLMAEANLAYENGDETQLRLILSKWEHGPESINGEGIAAELIRVIRKIAQIQERLNAIESEIEALKESAIYLLREKVIFAQMRGRNLLAEMAALINQQIATAKMGLEQLRVKVGVCA